MQLTSTRKNILIQSSQAIINGISDDQGLYVLKDIDLSFFEKSLMSLTYKELTQLVLKKMFVEFSNEDLNEVINTGYSSDNFGKSIITINDFPRLSILSLYNGPTFAFKDMALSLLPGLLTVSKRMNNNTKPSVILTATSGDTGSAALSGFTSASNNYVIVLYPKQGVSEFQERQMIGLRSETNTVIGIDGNFDDCQRIVKELFHNSVTTNIDLCSANSINIGRLAPQVVYYLYTYLTLVKNNKIKYGDKINFVVPSGNFGNIYAGYLAKNFGVPIGKLIIASNENDVLTDLFNKGIYNTKRELVKTSSPSMDILVSSNFERYLFNLYGNNHQRVKETMTILSEEGVVTIPELLQQTDFVAYKTTEEETLNSIKKYYNNYKFLIDPHTAVAVHAYEKYKVETHDDTYSVIVSTASPFKFTDAICTALDIEKNANLQDTIKHIAKITKTKLDNRIIESISSNDQQGLLTIPVALETVKKLIGDIDDKHNFTSNHS